MHAVTERFLGLSPRLWAFWALIVYLALGLSGLEKNTPTGDEHLHITRGLAWWWQDDARFSHAHPPLANLLQGIPGAATAEEWPFDEKPGWSRANVDKASRVFFKERRDARSLVVRGRLVTLLFGALLLLYLFIWLREQFSLPVAVAGVFLVGTTPMYLAHAQLVTTDFAVAAIMFVVFGETYRMLDRPGWHPPLRVGLLVGAAVVTKHSAPLGIVIIAALGLGYGWFKGRRYAPLATKDRVKRVLADLAIISVAGLLVINLAYRFDRTMMTMGAMRAEKEPAHHMQRKGKQVLDYGPFKKFPDFVPMPIPYMHVYGMSEVWLHSTGGHESYFKGEVRRTGWWDYFPTLLLIKTPVGALLLFGLALVLLWLRRKRPPPAILGLLLFAGLLLIPMMASSINIGARHALVVLVPLLVVAAWAAGQIWEDRRRARWAHGLVVAAVASSVVGSFLVPEYLGDFNFLVGREGGHDISIIGEDWSQDTSRFSRKAKKRKWKPLLYEPNSVGAKYEPKRFGVNYDKLTCKTMPDKSTYIAVHRARLYRRRHKGCYRWIKDAKRIDVINQHIEVYWWEKPPEPEPDPVPAPGPAAPPAPGAKK